MIMLFSFYLFFKLYFIFGRKDRPCEHDLKYLKFLLLLHKSNLKHHECYFQTGKYQEYSEFHADMMLVKTNCLKYNPPGHDVRQVSA